MPSFSNFKSTVIAAAQSAAGTTPGVSIYADRSNLPTSGNSQGDQAYVTGNNRLYIWNGSGWYNVALLNVAPAISSVTDSDGGVSPFALSAAGAVTTITITAADSDGDPITYEATADSNFGGLATISQADNVFTITPYSQDSATTTSGTITFTATDGINLASSGVQTFTLSFVSPYWDETVLSIGTSSTNSLANSTFVDRSANAHTVTTSGSPVQTAFHPYLDNWSVEFDGNDYLQATPSANDANNPFKIETGEFTIEFWVKYNTLGANAAIVQNFTWNSGTNAGWAITKLANSTITLAASSGVWNSFPTVFTSSTTIGTDWVHVAIQRNSSNKVHIYFDGVRDTSVDVTRAESLNLANGTTPAPRVAVNVGDGTFSSYSNCSIADLRISTVARYSADFTPTKYTSDADTRSMICHKNRYVIDGSVTASLTIGGDPKISAYNPFGQGSEYAPGENKGSGSFDGSSDYLQISNTTAFDFSSGYTCVEAWIYNDTIATGGGRNHLFSRGQTSSPYNGVYLRLENGYPDLASSGNDLQSSTICRINEWNHIVFQFNPNGEQSIWLNGTRVADRSNGPSTVEVDVVAQIGAYDAGSLQDGNIADLRIRNGSTAFYSGASITVPTSPVGSDSDTQLYLPMDNAGIFDKTGNNTLTLAGNTTTSTTQTKYATTSIYFDGSGDYIAFPLSEPKSGEDFTIECWFNVSGSARQDIGSSYTSTSGIGISLSYDNAYDVMCYNGNNVLFNSVGGLWSENVWNHLAVCRSGTNLVMYVNGIAAGAAVTNSTDFTSTNDFYLGAAGNNSLHITGYIENFQYLKGIAKYTANFTPPTQTQGRTYQAES